MADQNDTCNVSATVADLYPSVHRITLFVAFEEADSESEPNYQQIIFTPDSEAAFRLDCSREACVGGGFDFTPLIDSVIHTGEGMDHDRLACHGTLGVGGEGCSLRAEFRIIIDQT